jgi:hypothetical protein
MAIAETQIADLRYMAFTHGHNLYILKKKWQQYNTIEYNQSNAIQYNTKQYSTMYIYIYTCIYIYIYTWQGPLGMI